MDGATVLAGTVDLPDTGLLGPFGPGRLDSFRVVSRLDSTWDEWWPGGDETALLFEEHLEPTYCAQNEIYPALATGLILLARPGQIGDGGSDRPYWWAGYDWADLWNSEPLTEAEIALLPKACRTWMASRMSAALAEEARR